MGYRPGWFTDEDDEVYQARLRERQREMAASTAASTARVNTNLAALRAENNPSRMGARTAGVLAAIEVGVEIWEHHDPTLDLPQRGGIVVQVDSGGGDTIDDVTGEIVSRPARYRCYDSGGGWPDQAFRWVAEPDIDRTTVGIPRPLAVDHACRRFWVELAGIIGRKKAKSGPVSPFEAQLCSDAARLCAVLMGGHNHQGGVA